MISFRKLAALSIAAAVLVSACSSSSTATQNVAGASTGAAAGAGATTLAVMSIGGSNIIVDGSNSMTLYYFDNDKANSGKSVCTGGCATKWPPMTVASGTTPTVGAGASGKVATISRDDGTTQVTYNGLPVYHYQGDSKPGDTTGNYPGWTAVKA